MPSNSESCFLCPEIQGAMTKSLRPTAMMTGPWRGRDSQGHLRFSDQCGNHDAPEIWGQGSAFSSCTHSNIEPCRDRQPSRLKSAREGEGTAWRPSVHSLHSTALASLYSLPLGTPFMLKSMQAIFSQDFSQPGKSWHMGDVLSD